MNADFNNEKASGRSDLLMLAGAGALLTLCLFGLYLLVSAWFVRCASIPTNWTPVLGA